MRRANSEPGLEAPADCPAVSQSLSDHTDTEAATHPACGPITASYSHFHTDVIRAPGHRPHRSGRRRRRSKGKMGHQQQQGMVSALRCEGPGGRRAGSIVLWNYRLCCSSLSLANHKSSPCFQQSFAHEVALESGGLVCS